MLVNCLQKVSVNSLVCEPNYHTWWSENEKGIKKKDISQHHSAIEHFLKAHTCVVKTYFRFLYDRHDLKCVPSHHL